MRPGRLWQISIATTREAEAAVAELLETVSAQTATVYCEEATGISRVTVYCPARTKWNDRQRAALRTGLEHIRGCGLSLGSARISVKRIRRETWADSWRRHFKPVEIGSRLLIKPSWSRRRPRAQQVLVVLDPGLSFGTGHHPTTQFCLRQLVAARERLERPSCLDMGAGSGILAIAAAKLGYAPVHAFDNDAQAVRVARANARLNRVSHRLTIARRDLTRLPVRGGRRYDLVCANLTHDLLVVAASRILNRLNRGGTLVLAGVLGSQFPQVAKVFTAAGLRLSASATQKEWRSGAFRFPR